MVFQYLFWSSSVLQEFYQFRLFKSKAKVPHLHAHGAVCTLLVEFYPSTGYSVLGDMQKGADVRAHRALKV